MLAVCINSPSFYLLLITFQTLYEIQRNVFSNCFQKFLQSNNSHYLFGAEAPIVIINFNFLINIVIPFADKFLIDIFINAILYSWKVSISSEIICIFSQIYLFVLSMLSQSALISYFRSQILTIFSLACASLNNLHLVETNREVLECFLLQSLFKFVLFF